MTIRSFIAINLPPEIKEKLASVITQLKKANPRALIKWARPEIVHLTLHFLGGLEERELARVQEILASAVPSQPSFHLEIDKLDCFPDLVRPRVLFVSCRQTDSHHLIDLRHQIGQELKKIGLPIDQRPWRLHLTLGRVKRPEKIKLPEIVLKETKFKVKSIPCVDSKGLCKMDIF